uniref:Uncharacterized protein n=1 Tax=Molossus molossus TaxID=27622 RepID=A0A7J8HH74_MOLMO|nr:hypothetical protein HJG59_011005 [Molossus molossus]
MAGRGAINAGAEQTLPSRRRSVPRFAGRWPLRALGKAETNPPGSEKAGARQQDAQLTKKGGLLVRVCLWQTDGATAARRLAHQAGKTIFCPNKRLRRVRAAPRTCEGCGANPGLSEADLFPFAASDFGVFRAPSEGHAPVFIFVVRSLSRVVGNAGRFLLITLRYCMGTRFHQGLGKRNKN